MTTESSRPLLLPQNRRLRHLQGISLRNLTLSKPASRTADDAALYTSTPGADNLRDSSLHHAQSDDDLRHPSLGMRRRSSAWNIASPDQRQRRLEDLVETRMADTFFSLHCEGVEEPIYISEIVEMAMNPSFRFFDLAPLGPQLTRLDSLTIKIWARRNDFMLLLEERVALRDLQFLHNVAFPPNCLIFYLVDGIYTAHLQPKRPAVSKPTPSLPTSSYNALMRLSTLDESIQDALATREKIAAQINNILEHTPADNYERENDRVVLASRYVSASQRLLKQSIKRRAELQASLDSRQAAIKHGVETQQTAQEDVDSAREKLTQCRNLLTQASEEMHGQRRRICEELSTIYAIEPTSKALLFTIRSLPLPNTSSLDQSPPADEEVLAAALGHVAQLVNMLQYYLGEALPYPVTPYGSKSLITDNISVLADAQRVFPLYTKGTVRFRFDYGVFLLNKNIECLCEGQGLKVVDIRHTLPNLKYLLYVCSAGTKELPARKAGGVRGLLNGWSTPREQSLNSSVESGMSRRTVEKDDRKQPFLSEEENLMFRTGMAKSSTRRLGMRENFTG